MATMLNISREDVKLCVGKGWSGLIDKIYDALPEDAYITQVKEKFGGLRFYVEGINDQLFDFVRSVEDESYSICEVCGEEGKPREGGWIKTLCENHTSWRV